jgi:PAS domain S-box-containing protein
MAVVAYGLKRLFEPLTGTGAPFVLFFGAVVAASIWAGIGPAIMTALLGAGLGAYGFVVGAGYTASQAAFQGALFAFDAVVIIYLSSLERRARRSAELSREHVRELIELAPDAFFLADLEGRFTDVNQSACQMLGYERSELVGKTIMDIIPPEDAPRLASVREALLVPGRTDLGEWTHRRKDGSLVPVEVSANILPDGRWQAFARDISARRRIEDERQVYVSLLENSSDFIGIADPAGKPVYVNPAGRRMVGLPDDMPVAETRIPEYYPREERAFAEGVILKAMREHGRWSGETFFRHWRTGERIPVSDEHFIIRDPTGARVLGMGTVTRDISQARRTAREREELLARERQARGEAETVNQQLRESEARFSGIVSISADAIISIDEGQRITLFNDGAERIFGHARADVLGAPLDVLIPERLREAHRRHVAAFAQGAMTARQMGERLSTIAGVRKSGEEFPAEAAISKLQVGGGTILTVALRDVTERKHAEQALAFRAEAGALLASSLDYQETLTALARLIVRDLADFCVVDLIEKGEHPRRLTVVSADRGQQPLADELERIPLVRSMPHLAFPALATRRPFLVERVTPDDLESLTQNAEHLRLVRAIGPRSMMALPLLIRGRLLGALVLLSTKPSRVYGSGDVRTGEALASRAALAIENGRLYQDAVHATRLRDEVLAVVAHDLRNPLSTILLQAEAMQRKGPEPERRSPRSKETILRAGVRMQRLIRDLLDVSLVEAGTLGLERARLAVRPLVVESVEAQQSLAASASVELGAEVEPELPAVSGDRHRLLQVLENLAGNALKFTPAGGRVTIGAAHRPGEVLFWVADTGRGISRDALPHVFDRFWQVRRDARAGAGLGLAITRGIVEAHGGRIWVESTLGRGSIFFFTLPELSSAATALSAT